MSVVCLDTTVLLDLMAPKSRPRHRQAREVLAAQLAAGAEVVTTRFNVAELYVGVARSADARKEAAKVDAVLEGTPVLEFDDLAARLFGSITAHLAKYGKPAGDMDVLIAATAAAQGHALLTRNRRHFEAMPELTLLAYE